MRLSQSKRNTSPARVNNPSTNERQEDKGIVLYTEVLPKQLSRTGANPISGKNFE